MIRLEYLFDCLDGNYSLRAVGDEVIDYNIETTIPELASIEGQLNEEQAGSFKAALDRAHIEYWQRSYTADLSAIEDAVSWSLKYFKDGKEYVSKGEESYEPYEYNELIRALMMIDEKAAYFLIGEEAD